MGTFEEWHQELAQGKQTGCPGESCHPLVTAGLHQTKPAGTCKINFLYHFMHILSNTYICSPSLITRHNFWKAAMVALLFNCPRVPEDIISAQTQGWSKASPLSSPKRWSSGFEQETGPPVCPPRGTPSHLTQQTQRFWALQDARVSAPLPKRPPQPSGEGSVSYPRPRQGHTWVPPSTCACPPPPHPVPGGASGLQDVFLRAEISELKRQHLGVLRSVPLLVLPPLSPGAG